AHVRRCTRRRRSPVEYRGGALDRRRSYDEDWREDLVGGCRPLGGGLQLPERRLRERRRCGRKRPRRRGGPGGDGRVPPGGGGGGGGVGGWAVRGGRGWARGGA